MNPLPILSFAPLFKEVVWGGRELERRLGKALPPGRPIGESWELVDLPDAQSVVDAGPLAGTTLGTLRRERQRELLGPVPLLDGRFPILVKFIDATDRLSVQVHPDEAACRALGGAARPKSEAWYVVQRADGAGLYLGLRPGTTREALAAAVGAGAVDGILCRLAVEPGDFVDIPAGTVHALGAGIVILEVQQASDTTYRVFDWNRVGLDGRPRPLHVSEALACVDPAAPRPARRPASGRPGVETPSFTCERLRLAPAEDLALTGEGPLVLCLVAPGGCEVRADGDRALPGLGRTLLVPACRAGRVELQASAEGCDLVAVRLRAVAD